MRLIRRIIQIIKNLWVLLKKMYRKYSVRTEIYEKTFQAKWPFLLKMKIGHLEHYIMSRVSSSSGLLQKICAMLLDLSGFLIYAAMALKIDWRGTSWVLLS